MVTPIWMMHLAMTGGHMFPDHARLFMAGLEDADYKEEKHHGGNDRILYLDGPMEVIVTIVSKLVDFTYLRDLFHPLI